LFHALQVAALDAAVCVYALEVRAAGGDPTIPKDRYAVMKVQASAMLPVNAGYRQFGRMVAGHEYGIDFVLPVG
jgi:hypothetical protein